MALVLGVLIAGPLGQDRRISVEVWLIAVTLWLAWLASMRLIAVAPVLPARLRGTWRWRRRWDRFPDRRPRSLQAIEGLLLSAGDSDRAHALRLRPRLIEISNHHLRMHHGIDPETEPERAAALLGDLAWLVDAEAEARSPQLDEIDRLLDIVLAEAPGE